MAAYSAEAPLLDTYQAVVSAYSDFLIVAIHTILYERNIYPQTSFIKARKYNYPVRQSRHPKLCKWIMDAVAAVEVEMLKVKMALISIMVATFKILCQAVHQIIRSVLYILAHTCLYLNESIHIKVTSNDILFPDVVEGASAVQHRTLVYHEFADYISNIVHRCANLSHHSCPSP